MLIDIITEGCTDLLIPIFFKFRVNLNSFVIFCYI
jgi:hypothetical protein